MSDRATLEFYTSEGAAYAEWSAPSGEYAWIEKFISLTPENALLLDFGCGGGWAARRMLDCGRRAEGFDGSEGLVAEARKLTGLDVKLMRFDEFSAAARYDGIWASFCLLHAPRADMPGNLERIAKALKPGGLFYLGLKRGTGERRDKLGRFYAYFEPDELREMLGVAGFEDIDIREKTGGGYDGEDGGQVMHIFMRKAGG